MSSSIVERLPWTTKDLRRICDTAADLLTAIERHNQWLSVSSDDSCGGVEIAFKVFDLADTLIPTGHVKLTSEITDRLLPGERPNHFLMPQFPVEFQEYLIRLGGAVHDLVLTATGNDSFDISAGKLVRPDKRTICNVPIDAEQLRVVVSQFTDALGSQTDFSDLPQIEQDIIEALGRNCLTGDEIAPLAGYKYNSTFRACLAAMKRQGLLRSGPGGRRYRVA